MKHDIFFKKYLTFLFALVLICQTLVTYLPVNGEEALYSKILRLHVLANSDTDEDQALKLAVRDRILAELGGMYADTDTRTVDDAVMAVNANIFRLENAAKEVINERGYAYDVKIVLGEEHYPTREYENITLPAGVYKSVQVKIGDAEGKNWWCVLFPELCLASAAKADNEITSYVYEENGEKFVAAGFTPEEIKIITESESDEIKVKFRILEVVSSLFGGEE